MNDLAWLDDVLKKNEPFIVEILRFEQNLGQMKAGREVKILKWSPLQKTLPKNNRWKALRNEAEARHLYLEFHLSCTEVNGQLVTSTKEVSDLLGWKKHAPTPHWSKCKVVLLKLMKTGLISVCTCTEVLCPQDIDRDIKASPCGLAEENEVPADL